MPTKTPLALIIKEGPVPVPLSGEVRRYVLKVETTRGGDFRSFRGLAKDPVTGMSKDPQIIDWSEIPCKEEGWHLVEVFLLPDGTSEFIEISAEFENQGPQTRRLQVALPNIERFTKTLKPGKNLEINFHGQFLKGCVIELLKQTNRIRYWEQNADQSVITLEVDVYPGDKETVRFQLTDPTGKTITQTANGEELAVVLDGPPAPNQRKPSGTKPAPAPTIKTPASEESPKPPKVSLTDKILEEDSAAIETEATDEEEYDLSTEEESWHEPVEENMKKKSWSKVMIGIAIFTIPLLINYFFLSSFLKLSLFLSAIGSVVLSIVFLFFWIWKFRFFMILLLIINVLVIGAGVLFTKTSWFSKTAPQTPALQMIVQDDAGQPVSGADIFTQSNGQNNGALLATSDSLGRVAVQVKPQTPILILVERDGYKTANVSTMADAVIRLVTATAKVYLTSSLAVTCQVEVKTDDDQILQTVSLDGPEPKIIDVPVGQNVIFDFQTGKGLPKTATLNITSGEEKWSIEINSSGELVSKKL